MKTFRQVLQALNDAAAADPSLLDLPCVTTDDQCAHYEVSGHAFKQEVDGWPTEYCIDEALPPGATEFVRIC